MKINDLMERIRLQEIVLPEFQREYVWDVEQARQLLDSLYRDYPTGSLLFWDTTTPPVTKRAADVPLASGPQQLILDGQQRLTALYLVTQGETPPYYPVHELQHDPRDLLFDLATGAFHLPSGHNGHSSSLVSVVQCFRGEPDAMAIAKMLTNSGEHEALAKLAETCYANLARLQGVMDRDYPVQTVPITATLDQAIDVFDRVNSQGTKLTAADLALTHISGKWPSARQVMKDLLRSLDSKRFHFNLDFLIQTLAAVTSGQSQLKVLHYASAAQLQANWQLLAVALESLVDLLPTKAAIYSSGDLSSSDVLIVPVVYLTRHGGAFPSEQATKRALHWLYAASMWGRYSGETEQRLDYDLALVQRCLEPWADLVDALIEQHGRIEVRPSDLEGHGIDHPLYRMARVVMNAQGAQDWFTNLPLATAAVLHSHQLFPIDILHNANSDDQLLRNQANEIANLVFLASEPTVPLIYALLTVEKSHPQILAQHCIPLETGLWQPHQFDAFLSARRGLIAAAINARMQVLQAAAITSKSYSNLAELIAARESVGLELKSSLRWDVRQNAKNLELEQEVAKTIAAFLNTEGGILIIGVADNGNVYGIEHDMELVKPQNMDGFEQALRQLIRDRMSPEFSPYVLTHYATLDGKTVCAVRVYRSPRPVFSTTKPGQQGVAFFVRLGNLTQALNPTQVNSYIPMHWTV